jgi:hypothetical protein
VSSGNGSGGPTPEEIERIKKKIQDALDKEEAEKKAAEKKENEQ